MCQEPALREGITQGERRTYHNIRIMIVGLSEEGSAWPPRGPGVLRWSQSDTQGQVHRLAAVTLILYTVLQNVVWDALKSRITSVPATVASHPGGHGFCTWCSTVLSCVRSMVSSLLTRKMADNDLSVDGRHEYRGRVRRTGQPDQHHAPEHAGGLAGKPGSGRAPGPGRPGHVRHGRGSIRRDAGDQRHGRCHCQRHGRAIG